MEPKSSWSADILKYYIYRVLMKRFLVPVLALYMLSHGLSVAQIASIVVVSRLIALALEVPSGLVSDAFGHKRTLLAAQLVKLLSVVVLLFGTFEWFMIGSILFWGANAFVSGTREALLYERLMELGRQGEFKLHEGRAVGIGQAIGIASMALAGVTFTINPDLPIIITAVQFVLSFCIMATFQDARRTTSIQKDEGYFGLLAHFRHASRLFREHPSLLWVSLLQALTVGISFGSYEMLQPVLELVGLSAVTIGFYYAAERVISSITGFSIAALLGRFPERLIVLIFSLVTLLSLALFVFTSNPIMIVVLLLISNVGTIFVTVVVSGHINHTIPSGSRATAISMSSVLFSLGIAITAGAIGLLSHFMDLRVIIGAIALAGLSLYPLALLGYLRTARA